MSEAVAQGEKLEFKTELKQLLHLITHSLYSNKEIFLRELISNASDAINKVQFDSLAHDELLEGNKDWKIKIVLDKDAGNADHLRQRHRHVARDAIENLGTIAQSGTKAFLESLKQKQAQAKPDLIGQFGVGFYSAFMVADKVTVLSRDGRRSEGRRPLGVGRPGRIHRRAVEKPTRGTDVDPASEGGREGISPGI